MDGTIVNTIGAGKMKRELKNDMIQFSQMAIYSGIPQDTSAFEGTPDLS